MPPIRLGELFPAEDVVAQWVFSVSMVVDDLMLLHEPMRASSDNNDIRAMIATYRQMVTRLYEARRLIVAVERFPQVAEFLGVEKDPKILMGLRAAYLREPGQQHSPIERLYAALRHKSVHYPWVGESEVQQVLGQLAHVDASASVSPDRGMVAEWTTMASAIWTLGIEPGSTDWIDDFEPRRRLLTSTVGNWGMLWPVVLILWAKRRGIALEDIMDVSSGG